MSERGEQNGIEGGAGAEVTRDYPERDLRVGEGVGEGREGVGGCGEEAAPGSLPQLLFLQKANHARYIF